MIVAGVADPGPSLDFKTPAGITDTGYSTRSTRRALEKLVQRSTAAKIGQAEIAAMMAKSSASTANSQLFSLAK